jgi:hypothetical protein
VNGSSRCGDKANWLASWLPDETAGRMQPAGTICCRASHPSSHRQTTAIDHFTQTEIED